MRGSAVIVLAVACVGCGSDAPSVEWKPVVRETLVIGVEVTGALEAVDMDAVGPPMISRMWNFKIAFMATEGEAVEAGAPLVRFDASKLEQQLRRERSDAMAAAEKLSKFRSEAALRASDAELKFAEAEAAVRKARLVADRPADSTSSIELKVAALDLQIARGQVERLRAKQRAATRTDKLNMGSLDGQRKRVEARVVELRQAIDKMEPSARRAGTVIYETDWNGDKPKVGETVWRGRQVMAVASLDNMKAVGDVDEVDASKVAVKQQVFLRLEAHPDRELRGHITKVADTVGRKSPDNPLKSIRIDIAMESTEGLRILPGMRFRGRVETERAEGVLVIPVSSVFVSNEVTTVVRLRDGDSEPVVVELGRRSGDRVEVVAGLSEHDLISPAERAP